MFYEAHITSLGVNNKNDRQRELYDYMFAKVNTRFLHLMNSESGGGEGRVE